MDILTEFKGDGSLWCGSNNRQLCELDKVFMKKGGGGRLYTDIWVVEMSRHPYLEGGREVEQTTRRNLKKMMGLHVLFQKK